MQVGDSKVLEIRLGEEHMIKTEHTFSMNMEHPYPVYAHMQETSPVFQIPTGQWVILDYENAQRLLQSPKCLHWGQDERIFAHLPPLEKAIVFDHTLFHASPPNMGGTDRVVCVSALLPEEKPTFFYFRDVETAPVKLEAYRVKDDFYLNHQLGFNRPIDILPDHCLPEAPPPDSFSFFSTAFPKIN